MDELLFNDGGLTLTKRHGRYFVRYDADAHMIVMREDEVTASEAERLMQGEQAAYEVLLGVQRRIAAAGGDPYRSNLS